MNSVAQNLYGEQRHTTMFLANSCILNPCRPKPRQPATSFPSSSLRGCCAGCWGCWSVQKWDLLPARAACSVRSACRNRVGAGSYFLPFELLRTFLLILQPEMSSFLTTVQGSTSEILPSLGFTTPPHTHNTFYFTPDARTNTIHVFGRKASRLRLRESHAARWSHAASWSSAAVFV